jgi:apolipoprotein N-acyltransferase
VDTETEWTQEKLDQVEHSMELLSTAPEADLTVWPEVPAPFYPSSRDFQPVIARVTRALGHPLLFGGVAKNAAGAPLNSAFLADAQGRILDRYDKIKLVPFGEFVPPIFGFVNRITNEAGDFAAGSRIVVFNTGTHRIAAFICYESVFPDLVRQFTGAGAEVLMNLSNDGYFGTSSAREQHMSLVRMRAAENGRWILRATNDGLTVLVDPAGRIRDSLPPYRDIAGTMKYNFLTGLTPYVRFGDWFAWSCLAAGLLAVLHTRFRFPS